MKTKISLHYADINNFGDALNIDVFRYFGYEVKKATVIDASVSGIGSIMGWGDKSGFSGYVLGSGIMEKEQKVDGSRLNVRLVRGPLTLGNMYNVKNKDVVKFGDPGLICPYIWKPSTKTAKVGVFPHYIDQENDTYKMLCEKLPNMKIIDAKETTDNVISSLTSCELIISSSLHGIVVSDAYGIPSIWTKFSENIRGGDFKFNDYCAGLNYNRKYYTVKELIEAGNIIDLGSAAPKHTVKEAIENITKAFVKSKKRIFMLELKKTVKQKLSTLRSK
jgi:pyruvyltransferase